MAASNIVIKGAREHNLCNIDLTLPRNELVCFTGVSGSGKSSLAFDTLYAEGQRRYVESLSSFARQFLGQMPKPDVDLISGLSPSISIAQKSTANNPRSTVGTITEIYDYLRVLYARVGTGHCSECGRPITAQTREEILQQILDMPTGTKAIVLAPLIRGQKGEYRDLFADMLKQGFVRARVDGEVVRLTDDLRLDRQMRHHIEVVVDRLTIRPSIRTRLAEAVDLALDRGEGNLIIAHELGEDGKQGQDLRLSAHYACTHCQISFEPPTPQLFSFNSPQGMCGACDGLGDIYSFDPERIVTDPHKSFQQGCIEVVGQWRDLGRWKRHIYRGVAETLERDWEYEPGTILETAWEELDDRIVRALLWGTDDKHITFTWRAGSSGKKRGGTWEGIIPTLLTAYKNSKNRMHRRYLEKYMRIIPCATCGGQRLNAQASSVRLTSMADRFNDSPEKTLPELCNLAVSDAAEFFTQLKLDETRQTIAAEAVKEICGRLKFLSDVGLDYLTLARTAPTLSGGEMQRIRLAGQIGSGLVGVLYILDEPSIGLHPRDNDRLLGTLQRLRDQGNTVLVVEHDEDTMWAADTVVDFGPGPGVRGGHVVAIGSAKKIAQDKNSVTGAYLSGRRMIPVPETRRPLGDRRLIVRGAKHNNLKDVDIEFPLGTFICVTGVSGSGKSSLVNDILVEVLRRDLNHGLGQPGEHRAIEGLEHLDKMIAIDQSPIGRTPRSNPGTYIKVFDEIRSLFSQLPQSKQRGYKPGRFSFNVSGGRCEVCEGNGSTRLEMDFLADIWVTCPVCNGHRFNRETLQVQFKGRSIAQVLEMDIQEGLEHFMNVPKIHDKLKTLHDVGLDYMKIGQPSPTLSGGEAQRVKLARELVKKSTGRTFYTLDEPTTGLHFADIELLLKVLHDFADVGNTVVVVEHNLEVIKTADWVIDLGPEGGEGGGWIVAQGTPEEVAKVSKSHTGRALREMLKPRCEASKKSHLKKTAKKKKSTAVSADRAIRIRGAQQNNLKGVNVEIPRDKITVCCGMSGSGKTSLAMDTVYAEGQRRYVESLSSYARQFVGQMQKPKYDHIDGLSPAVAIEQKHTSHSPRSTVGTVTEIYDYLRILMARLGHPYCPDCNKLIGTQSADEIIGKVMSLPEETRAFLLAPVEIHVGEKYEILFEEIRKSGYIRVRIDGKTYSIDEVPTIDRRRKHEVEIVVDRLVIRHESRSRIADSIENALSLGQGVIYLAHAEEGLEEADWPVDIHSQHFACDSCGRSFEPLTPHHFSFNSSLGWCSACEGIGTQVGAGPAALLHDTKRSLADGAIDLFPRTNSRLFNLMLQTLHRDTGIPIDVPFDQLGARFRRILFHGTGERWFNVFDASNDRSVKSKAKTKKKVKSKTKAKKPLFRFQFKGLYPSLEEASRVSPRLRSRLEHLVDEVECSECGGSRLRDDAAAVRLHEQTMDELCRKPLGLLLEEFRAWEPTPIEQEIAGELIREVRNRLEFLIDVGLDYLTVARPAPSLSGGEMQRIRLAAQVGSGLCGVLYVLDEPTIGLHPRDNRRLLNSLRKLRDLGNTLLMVEHDREVVQGADLLLDFGPRAGRAGGEIVARGTPEQIASYTRSVTGPYLSGKKAIAIPTNRRMVSIKTEEKHQLNTPDGGWLQVIGARHNNLKQINARFPLGAFTVVSGPSGSGKSSLVNDILYTELARTLHRAKGHAGAHTAIRGLERINKVIRVTQQAIGQTPTSNPATFTGVFDLIRTLFAQLPESKMRGYTARRFSFNVSGGRCEACEGAGQQKIEMHFLPDVWVECETCGGRRYNPETLEVRFHSHSIADVLDLSCADAMRLFGNIPKIRRILKTLCDVGLDYITLGQPAPTLSGGEAQRVKLATELSRPDTGKTLYLLDEPTTGLHFEDLHKLLDVLNRLVDLGNSVVVIEHNLDVIKTADWVIDIGPEAGDDGGLIVAEGTPEDIVEHAKRARSKRNKDQLLRCHTGEALAATLEAGPYKKRAIYDFAADEKLQAGDLDITTVGREARMPWEADGSRWHTRDRVSRKGTPCRWDGKILKEVIERIEQSDNFSPTDWGQRSVVEVRAAKKSLGWFFHAITAEEWILKMKFRVARRTFQAAELIEQLDLKPLNDMPDLPLYGTENRTKCKTLGKWQEVELRVHSYDEIDRPEFWDFLDRAINGFGDFTEKADKKKPSDLMPWKALGRAWHFARRGFPLGKKPEWDVAVLEKVVKLLEETVPEGEFLWTNKVTAAFRPKGKKDYWASFYTKKPDAVHLFLSAPQGRFPLGRLTSLGFEPNMRLRGEEEIISISYQSIDQIDAKALKALLKEHLRSV